MSEAGRGDEEKGSDSRHARRLPRPLVDPVAVSAGKRVGLRSRIVPGGYFGRALLADLAGPRVEALPLGDDALRASIGTT
jgi:hypothetical protein